MAARAKRDEPAAPPARKPSSTAEDAASAWARIEQEDRQRLAARVHNELQQYIAAARMHIGMAVRPPGPISSAAADEILHLLDQCVDASRALTLDLFPRILHTASLAEAVHWLAKSLEAKFAVRIEVRARTDVQLEQLIAFAVFRVAHEALFNIAQHAGVREACVTLDAADDSHVRITIEDCGAGFDPASLENKAPEASALRIACDRVRALGGKVELHSSPGWGARIVIQAPSRTQSGA